VFWGSNVGNEGPKSNGLRTPGDARRIGRAAAGLLMTSLSWSAVLWLPLGGLALALPQTDEADPPGPAVQESSSCALCHSNAPRASAMRDAAGREIAPYDLWRGTMMANAARDPLWRAAMSAEIAATPSRRAEIEQKCLGCHAPMAARVGLEEHDTGSLAHALDCDAQLGDLARDGVSCTICHGMSPEGLGTDASYTAGFHLDPERRLFGPHEGPFAMPMRMHTGFTPTHGEHVAESALCASCHTLETEALAANGDAAGARLLEQAPYLEWRNSDFRDEGPDPGPLAASCQDCHVPTADEDGEPIRTRIARNPGGRDFPPTSAREPVGRHRFVGGNTLVLSMLADRGEELGVEAPPEAVRATLAATREQLREAAARVAIENVRRDRQGLSFDVRVENLTGHKLPTGHPMRRAWLRVVVRDASGAVLFASGETDSRGRIVGAAGRPLASELADGPIEPHRNVVRGAGEVAIYGAVLADASGTATHTLLRGATWLVDDRLLPRGWSREHPDGARTAPVGVEGDDDFGAGGDRVRYEVDAVPAGAFTIEAELLYQPLGARWAAELLRGETPEIETFRRMYEEAERSAEVLASDRWRE